MNEKLKEMSDLLTRPKNPSRPRLVSTTPSEEEMIEYQEKVKNYCSEVREYEKNKEKYYNDIEEIYEFIKQEGGLYDIPEQYQKKVWSKALEKDSYFEVYQELDELTDLFFNFFFKFIYYDNRTNRYKNPIFN